MHPIYERARRDFLTSSASGLGLAALGSLLTEDGVLQAAPQPGAEGTGPAIDIVDPLRPRQPHFAPKAKACIFFLLEGAPSQLDLFDPKPKLNELDGQKLPDSLLEKVRFAFIKKETVRLMGSPRKFTRHGECGMELSDFLPHVGSIADDLLLVRGMHTDQFNHHPGQLVLQCGRAAFGLPCMGSWLTWGLGSPSRNLPGYAVLTCGRGSSGGATLWQSGFLPSVFSGTWFRNQGDPVLNLANPAGLPPQLQRAGLDALRTLNESRYGEVHDPEIAARIANYELAWRMQSSAPELIDLSGETKATLEAYGLDRTTPPGMITGRGGGANKFHEFARNCLLARRLVERGVRFVNIIHASWDHHSDLNKELESNAWMADRPFAALIRDLKQRGLLDETLVVWGSEFGRTPLGENRGGSTKVTGRDHHPFAYSLMFAGGGLRGGHVDGVTDEIGWSPVENPVHVNDMQATLLHLFGLDHLKLTHRYQGRDFRLTDVRGEVVRRWLA